MPFDNLASKDGVVDWSKGPADATMYKPETYEDFETFMKVEGDTMYFQLVEPQWRYEVGVWYPDELVSAVEACADPVTIFRD